MAFQTIRRNLVRNQPHAIRVRGVDLDRPGLPVWLEGRPSRVAAVKRAYQKLTFGHLDRIVRDCAPLGTSGV